MFALSGRSALYTVMAKTIRDLLGARRVIVAILGGQALATFLSLVAWADAFEGGRMGLDMQTSYLVGYFITVSFFWMTGLFLAYMVVGTSGLELVDQERKRGTLLLIVSKPIGRLQFLAGKFLALVLTAALLEATILVVSAMATKAMLGFGPHVLTARLKALPWIFLFSLLVIVVFTAVSVALSTLVRSALVRNGVFMLVLIAVFAVGPVMRMAWPDIYEDYRVYYLDGGYNLGNVYVDILDNTAAVRLGPQAQAWLGITRRIQDRRGRAVNRVGGSGGRLRPRHRRHAALNGAVDVCLACRIAGGHRGGRRGRNGGCRHRIPARGRAIASHASSASGALLISCELCKVRLTSRREPSARR
jgi:ABC-type transport system involved in multi-copper enzyme maturation permease subunit